MQIPVRALVIINTMDVGGAETFIMKVYRTIDKNKIQFDFLINKQEKCFYEDEIESMGGFIYRGIPKSKNFVKSFTAVYKIIKENEYSIVFCVAVHPLVAIDLIAAKLGEAKIRLVRSTNSSAGGGIVSNVLASIFRPMVRKFSTVCLAPSREAGVWMFGEKAMESSHVKLIANGIDVDKYVFNKQKRIDKREEFNLKEKFVIGHIGRFNKQKNHLFLLDIFRNLLCENSNSVLLLVGTGELENVIREKAVELGIIDYIIFTGVRTDVSDLLMAIDVLVFPSLFEGMPNVVIEAQATGLPCIISDTITKEVAITNLVEFISLSESSKKWAKQALRHLNKQTRESMKDEIIKKGYSIDRTAKILLKAMNLEQEVL